MRATAFALLIGSGALLLSGSAAAAPVLAIVDLDVYDANGEPLTRVPVDETARFVVVVENRGPGNYTDPLRVVLHITNRAKTVDVNRTVQVSPSIPEGEEYNLTMDWTPNRVGDHTLVAYIDGVAATRSLLEFTVARTSVLRGTLSEFALQYVWFYAAFVATMALFLAVRRTRGPPG